LNEWIPPWRAALNESTINVRHRGLELDFRGPVTSQNQKREILVVFHCLDLLHKSYIYSKITNNRFWNFIEHDNNKMVEMDSTIGIGRQARDKVAKSASRPLEVVLEVP